MSWPPLRTLFAIIVTSVAANHHGANCDCASQGPWQPLFKPSQILHSEFPEHQNSDSTGGPKPTKVHHYKLVPHIVVPLVNPVALAIHHHTDNHIHTDEKPNKHNTKDYFGKHKTKEVHYHYNFPDPNESNYNPSSTATPTVTEGSYINNGYPEDEGNQQSFPDEGVHDHQSQSQGQGHGEDYHHSQEEDGSYGAYGASPTDDGPSYETTTHDQHYSHEEQPTYDPYYASGEQSDAVYDASKLSPGYQLKPTNYPVYRAPPTEEGDNHFNNYYHPNKLDVRGKTRGKSIYIPVYRLNHSPNGIKPVENGAPPYKFQETNTDKPLPSILPTNPSFLSDHRTLASNFVKTIHPHPHRVPFHPLPLVHPPFSLYSPWKLLMKDEARRMILMRPPAPGLPDTWTTTHTHTHPDPDPDSNAQLTKVLPSKVKMTGVIYPIKNFQI